MGVVYAARDTRLERDVALKTVPVPEGDPSARERFWREARAAARVSHPRICQLFDVGEAHGRLFLAMELLEGESLASCLTRGALPVREAVQAALGILSALEELHRAGLVHRDLKPSNVFLTPNGIKLLDFGLARPAGPAGADAETRLTVPGTIVGTPQYLAPERISGAEADARGDLFAAGALLFEMLAGRPAFGGATLLEVLHSVAHDQPPVLSGSPAVSALDAIVHRALAKRPGERYATAADMAGDLRAALARVDTGVAPAVRAVTRVIVLPFRMLRADAEVDFLAFSLPDAITASLSGLDSIVVRSSLAAARFADAGPATLAAEAQVDLVLSGTLLRAGDQVRIHTQLMEVPSGTVVWSHTAQVALGDVFQVQDTLTRRIVDSLAAPLNARDSRRLRQDVPASPVAYEYFLRANTLSTDSRHWTTARDLYRQCVELDPGFAPAWARLGRCYRVLAKFDLEGESHDSARLAEQAFARALELNPDLSVAHHLSMYLEVERGRALPALVQLLARLNDHLNDPELYAGVVHACRYVGLLDASIAAFERAKRLDPNVRTSVAHTFFMAGDYERVLAEDIEVPPYTSINSLLLIGREDDARTLLSASRRDYGSAHLSTVVEMVTALLDGDSVTITNLARRMLSTRFHDPEGWYYWGRTLLAAGQTALGCDLLVRTMNAGYHCFPGLVRDPWLDPIRSDPGFVRALRIAERGHREALAAFEREGGPLLLAMP